jgi:hypothetical protein
MHRFACKRKLICIGRAAYINLPKLARLELNLCMNDEVLIELDTKRKLVIIRAVEPRAAMPFRPLEQIDMLSQQRAGEVPPGAEQPTTPAPIREKVPA